MITGDSFGVVQGFALLDVSTGDTILFSDLKGGTGTPGPKGDKGDTGPAGPKGDTGAAGAKGDPGNGVKSVVASKVGTVVTLTFTLTDNTTTTATFDLA